MKKLLMLIPVLVMPLGAQPQQLTLPPLQLRTFMATSSPANHPQVKVSVPDDYLLISGGCRDNYYGWGNLLVASYPESPNTWVCIGKDHNVADPSTIDGFAVAIYDPNHAWLATIQSQTSSAADWPQATVTLPVGNTLTGGGAIVHYTGWGNMLTASMPYGTTGWTAKAKDQGVADPSTLTVYAIGIRPRNGAAMPAVTIFQNRSAPADHPATSVGVGSGYTLLGCGVFADWHSAGQLVTATYPSTRSECSVQSKDHDHFVEVSSVVAYAIAVPVDPSQGQKVTTISSSGQAVAIQNAVLRVERDIFRNGGWWFRWVSPNPKGDGYSYSDAALQLKLGDVIPPGSNIISAVLNYSFSNFAATTSDTRPTTDSVLGGNHARAPRDHGSDALCSYCSPASVDHWGPAAAFFANRVQLGGQNTYSFPGPPASPSGSLDLLAIYPASALAGNTLTFYGTVQYNVGRPFFATEGLNADTEFDVLGQAQVDVSASIEVSYTLPSSAAAPTFTPVAGTYSTAQSVVIGNTTPGAVTYYTTNGTTPTTASTRYGGPIPVNSGMTIQAIAIAPGFTQSAAAVAVYVIQSPTAAPTFTPSGGSYAATQTVIISGATAGATIYVTDDGTVPTTASPQYAGPITVSTTKILKAIVVAPDHTSSIVATAAYTIQTNPPTISSVSPNPVPPLNGNQPLLINGSEFQNASGLKVRLVQPTGQTDLQGSAVSFLASGQLSIQVNVGTTPGNWSVQVINPDGQSSNIFSFAVAPPATTTSFALPQFVFGNGWHTALYFSNTTNSSQGIQVNFFGDSGTPLKVPLLGIGTVSSQTMNLDPHSSVILEAPNAGLAGQGWAEAVLPTGVVGYAVFRQSVPGRADQEAVVPLAPENSQAADLIYDDGIFTTAVAFLNPSNQSTTLTIAVSGSDGSPLGSSQVVLSPHEKQAVVLNSLAGLGGMAGQRGRAVFTVPGGAISVLGLRFGGAALTSIPVTHRNGLQFSPGGPSTSFALPQLVFGGGWYTALYFSNTTTSDVSFPVNFIGDDGTSLNVPLLRIGTVSSQFVSLSPGETVIFEAPNTLSTFTEGWVNTALPFGVIGYAVLRQSVPGRYDQEAVVPLTSESYQIANLVYDDVNFTTAVAFANPSAQQVTIAITAYASNGAQIGSSQVVLQPYAKEAIVLKNLPGMLGVAGNRGWATFSVSNGAVSVLGLRFGGQSFTSIPVSVR